jgi:hypothetical protein
MDFAIMAVVAIMFVAATIQGTVGFGRALIAAPMTALFYPADETVVLMIMLGFVGGLVMVAKTYKYSNIKKVVPMLFFGIAGVVAGVMTLSAIPVKGLKITMGAFVILSAAMLASGLRIRIKNEKLAYSIAGLLGGYANGALSFGGPPTVLFLQNQEEQKNAFRANLSIFFTVIGLSGIINLFAFDMVTVEISIKALILAVPCVLGTYFGNFLSHKLHEDIFKKMVLAILFIAGAMAVILSVF